MNFQRFLAGFDAVLMVLLGLSVGAVIAMLLIFGV